jgi:hypothetical protein
MPPDRAQLEATVHHLAGIEDRGSATPGEREAAEWIAQRMRELGAGARIEEEKAHGTFWWPGTLANAMGIAGAVAALRGKRLLGAALGAVGAAGLYDDVTGGSLWFRRRLLPHRSTWNVVAEAGDPDAERTLVFISHHDAAHGGLIFDPSLVHWMAEKFPERVEEADEWPPLVIGTLLGPSLVTIGSLTGRRGLTRFGAILSATTIASLLDIAFRKVVPGANDNLTAVAVLLDLARALKEEPVEGLRVILLSTGSEESYMEGMQGFGRRHFPELDKATTTFVCLDTVGSETELVLVEGEGMVVMNDYPEDVKEMMMRAAERAGVHLRRGLKLRFATDGLIALKAGYPTAAIGSCDRYKLPSNYHKPTDTAANVNFDLVEDAAKLSEAFIRELAPQRSPQPA